MKATNILLSVLLLTGFAANNSFAAEYTERDITCEMRKDMFWLGALKIKDKEGGEKGEFHINYLPGATNVINESLMNWGEAKDALMVYLQGEKFWEHEVWDTVVNNLKFGWDANKDYGFGAIDDDMRWMWKDFNSVSIKEFGGLGHMMLDGAGLLASIVFRPIIGTGALLVGAAGALFGAPCKMMIPVLKAGKEGLIEGTAVPVIKMTWNGTAWAATQVYSKLPPEQDSLVVTWVKKDKKVTEQ